MRAGSYLGHSLEGLASIREAVARWRHNPLVRPVLRRMWGPTTGIVLVGLAAAAAAIEVWLPDIRRLAGIIPPAVALAFVPRMVTAFIFSGAAFLGFVTAWRVRGLRSDPGDLERLPSGDTSSGALVFEAAVLPAGLVAIIAACAACVLAAVLEPAETSVTTQIRQLAAFVMTAAVTGGVLVARRATGSALGQLLSAGFSIWVLHLVVGFAAPWMLAWWQWIPGLGDSSHPVTTVHAALDLAIVSAAWVTLRQRFAAGVGWHTGDDRPPPADP